jgi:hypothetical protein
MPHSPKQSYRSTRLRGRGRVSQRSSNAYVDAPRRFEVLVEISEDLLLIMIPILVSEETDLMFDMQRRPILLTEDQVLQASSM